MIRPRFIRTANAVGLTLSPHATFHIFRWSKCARIGFELAIGPEGTRACLTCFHRSFDLGLPFRRRAYKTLFNRARY